MQNTTLGVIITNRSFFPSHLVTAAREKILAKLQAKGINTVILGENETELGAVVTYQEAQACARLFSDNRDIIDGILVILPNFGEETGVAAAIDLARLNVPVLVQACDDSLDRLHLDNRRDAFCGKLSLCNNLYQRDIKYSLTKQHTCDIDSPEFDQDLDFFTAVCRVVRGVRSARIAAIGARPDAFHTVRFSEKLLQKYGITVSVADMSEIIFAARDLGMSPEVEDKITEIKAYGKIAEGIAEEKIILQAKLILTIEKWVADHECCASAIQCWDSIQNNYGIATCLSMSMMGEKGLPSACEMDITGALTMYALYLASGTPSAYFDWNNNFADDRNKCINLHCSNFPKSFFGHNDFVIGNLGVLSTTIGADRCFGACKAQIKEGPMTYAKITTDDKNGKIKLYVGEGEFLKDRIDTEGGCSVCSVPDLQELLTYMCRNGYEHHVAMNRAKVAGVLEEALGNYLGWEVYRHS